MSWATYFPNYHLIVNVSSKLKFQGLSKLAKTIMLSMLAKR